MDSTTRTVLGLCKNIEELCAEIYFFYARAFTDLPEISRLWEQTAYEERNHANVLKLALNCKDLELTERTYDVVRYRTQERIVRAIHDNLQQSRPSLEDALRSSIHLEKKLAEFHLECVAEFKHLAEEQLFRALARDDEGHIAHLEHAYRILLEARRDHGSGCTAPAAL